MSTDSCFFDETKMSAWLNDHSHLMSDMGQGVVSSSPIVAVKSLFIFTMKTSAIGQN